MAWKRKSYVTRGPDPTQVVQWTDGKISITEFQGAYQLHRISQVPNIDELAEELHKALEGQWEARQELDEATREDDYLVAEAERKAGWDPNP